MTIPVGISTLTLKTLSAHLITRDSQYGNGPAIQLYGSDIPSFEIRWNSGHYERYDLGSFLNKTVTLDHLLDRYDLQKIETWATQALRYLHSHQMLPENYLHDNQLNHFIA